MTPQKNTTKKQKHTKTHTQNTHTQNTHTHNTIPEKKPGLETFLTNSAEDTLWFVGQHPDKHGGDFEPNSVWGAVEFRLGRGELERALADANLAFLMLCA